MTATEANLAVCQQALYLLRQDVGLPSLAEAATDSSLEWAKCKIAFDAAIAEVWNLHDWNARLCLAGTSLTEAAQKVDNWTQPMRQALAYCVARELAIPLAGRVEDLKNWDGLFREKAAKARVVALREELAAVTDELHKQTLKLVLPHFSETDGDLPRSIKEITDRIDAQKESAIAEIWNAHDWQATYPTATSDSTANWSAGMKDALVHLLAEKMNMPMARREGETQAVDALYRDKLAKARVVALETERSALSDPLAKEIVANVLPRFSEKADPMPRSIRSVLARANALADAARSSVLTAQAWNFARAEEEIPGCPVPHGESAYRFASELPPSCARLLAVYTHAGRIDQWKLLGRTIVATMPIRSAVFVKDSKRPEKWPPLVYQCYVLRLSADVARTEMPPLGPDLEQKYQMALAEAKVRDARESHTPDEIAGRNHYVDAMHGSLPGAPRLPRHSFHGLI